MKILELIRMFFFLFTLFPCVLNCSFVIFADKDFSPCLYDDNGSFEPQCHNFTTPSLVPLKSIFSNFD
jgi:hypothetical protein